MTLISSVFVLLASAHLLGRACLLLRQPPIAGHMIAGILLGPSVLAWIAPNASLAAISNISLLMVVLTAGLEMRLQDVLTNLIGRTAFSSLIAFALPALAGAGVAAAFSLPTIPVLVVAMCVAVTALPVALQILTTFALLRTRVATVAISGALLSDIIVFATLGVLIEVATGSGEPSVGFSIVSAIVRLAGLLAMVFAARFACVRAMRYFGPRDGSGDSIVVKLSLSLLFILVLATISELLGFHFAIGAFFAAMMLTPELLGERPFEKISSTCATLTAALFGPLFLAYQGMQFHAQSLSRPDFLVSLIVAAVLAKLIGGYYAARRQGMSKHDSIGVGIVMNARGVMELVAASIAFHAALIDATVFSALLLVGLITTALTPMLLQRWQESAPVADEEGRPVE